METKQKINIGSSEIFFALLSVFIVKIVVAYTQNMTTISGTASWISMIYVTILTLISFMIIMFLMRKFDKKDIVDICTDTFGKFIGKFYGLFIGIFLILRAAMILRQIGDRFKLEAFPSTPISFIILFLIVAAIIAVNSGINTIFSAAKVIIPFVFIALIIVLIISFEFKDMDNIFPVLGNGYKSIFWDSVPMVSIFTDIVLLLLLPPYVKNNASLRKTGAKIILTGGVCYTLTTLVLLTLIPYSSSKNIMVPIYLLGGVVSIGEKAKRLEAIFLIAWILALLMLLSLFLIFAVTILRKSFNLPDHKPLIIPIGGIVFFTALIPISNINLIFFEQKFYEKYGSIVLFILPVIILIISNIKTRMKVQE